MPKNPKPKRGKSNKNSEAIAKLLAEIDLNKRATDAVQADRFMSLILDIMRIYGELGEPFVTSGPTPILNLRCTPEWRIHGLCKNPKRLLPKSPLAELAGLREKRLAAQEATERVVERWSKSGIPKQGIWTALQRIHPGKRRWLADIIQEHEQIVALVESQREACFQLFHLCRPETAFIVLPAEVLSPLMRSARKGVELCTIALDRLQEGTRLLSEGKALFLNKRNVTRTGAITELVHLRCKHVSERKADIAQTIVRLLRAWDPETEWNARSIRVGFVYGNRNASSL